MSDLEQQYRQAPKLKSPTRLDNTILQAAANRSALAPKGASRAGTRPSGADPEKAKSWWKPGMVIASLCAVGVGLGVALQSGMLPQSGPASIDYELADNRTAATLTASDAAGEGEVQQIENDNLVLEESTAITELSVQASVQMDTDADSQADELADTVVVEKITGELTSEPTMDVVAVEQGSLEPPSVESIEVAQTSVTETAPESLSGVEIENSVASISATRPSVASADAIDATLYDDSDALGKSRVESFAASGATADLGVEAESVIVPLDDLQAQIADEKAAALAEQGIAPATASVQARSESRMAKRNSTLGASPEPAAELESRLMAEVAPQFTAEVTAEAMAEAAPDTAVNKIAEEGVAVNLWLLQQDSNNYTVQIAQSETESILVALAKNIPLPTEVVGFEQDYRQWLLLHGSYPSQRLAEDALRTLLQAFSKNGVSESDLNAKVVRIGDIKLSP